MAEMVEIKASLMNGKEKVKEHAVLFNFGANLEEAAEMFTAEVVHSNFVRASKVVAQSILRRLMEAGKTDEEIDAVFATWKPGIAIERTVDPEAALLAKFGKMDAEQQAAFIAELQARRAKVGSSAE